MNIWEKIREEYYKKSNPKQYASDLAMQKRIELLRIEIACCTAAITCFELTNEILPAFEEFGYDVKDIDGINRVRQKLLVKNTKFTLLIAKQENESRKVDKNEAVSFWDQVADLESVLNRQIIDVENITLIRWISLINQVKRNNERRENRKR